MGDRQQRRHLRPTRRVRGRRGDVRHQWQQRHARRIAFRPRRPHQDRRGHDDAVRRQQLSGRYGDQRRHRCGHRGRQSRRGGRRPRFRRRHAAIPVGFHHQSHRNAECGRRHIRHQWQQRNACRRDRRSRRPHQCGRRHDDAVGRQHLSRRHDGQCRHAAGRSSECLRSGQRPYDRERRHAQPRGLQPEHRLARRRRRRDLGRCNTHHRQRQHQHDLLRRDLRHWRPGQDRHRHAAAHGDQQLYRRDHRQRRHAVGKRLDRQLRPHRQCRRHHRRQRDDRQHHHQRRHALARQLDRHPHRTGQPGADVGRRLHRRGLAHGCRSHQRHRHREPGRHRAGGVRPGSLHRAHLHHPLGCGRKHRHLRQPHHHRPPGRLHREPELHRDRRDPEPHRHLGRTERARDRRPEHQPEKRRRFAQTPSSTTAARCLRASSQSSVSPAAISPMR